MSEQALPAKSLKSMAAKVAFVSFDVIQFREKEMRSHWYRYEDIDLYYFQTDDGRMTKIHVSVFGQIIEWNPYDGVRTGCLIESEGEGGVSEMVEYDERPHAEALKQALEVLENAIKIEAPQREQMRSHLTNPTVIPRRANMRGRLEKWRQFFKSRAK